MSSQGGVATAAVGAQSRSHTPCKRKTWKGRTKTRNSINFCSRCSVLKASGQSVPSLTSTCQDLLSLCHQWAAEDTDFSSALSCWLSAVLCRGNNLGLLGYAALNRSHKEGNEKSLLSECTCSWYEPPPLASEGRKSSMWLSFEVSPIDDLS